MKWCPCVLLAALACGSGIESDTSDGEGGIRYPAIRVESSKPSDLSVPRPSRNLYAGKVVEYQPRMDLDSLAENWPYLQTPDGHASFYALDSLLIRRGLPRPVFRR